MKRLSMFLFVFAIIVYLITSAGNTPYDYFTRLADAFLHGRYWLEEQPPWLSELIPTPGNKYYVVYPPMPAILSIPFVWIFGKDFPQQYLAYLLGAGLVILTTKLAYSIKRDKKLAIWSGLLIGFGSIVWHLSSNGSAWYLGQISAVLFLTAALVESLNKKRLFLIGLFLGAAYLSRLHTILSLPLFLYLLRKRVLNIKGLANLVAGILPFVMFNSFYNYVRFGVVWDKAYTLIPGLLNEPWYDKGLFHPSYVPQHLKVMFASFPIFKKTPPFIQPSWKGLAIWITTPAFVYALKAMWKEKAVRLSWLAILAISIPILMHGTTGFAQFGYRFAVDFYPILIFLTIKGVTRTGLKKIHWILLLIGILVNLWGVVWINKFGWVSY